MGLVSRLDCFAALAMTVLGIVLLSWSLRSQVTRRFPPQTRHCEPQSGAAIHGFCLTAGLLRCARNDGFWDCFVELVLAEPSHPQSPPQTRHCEPHSGAAIQGFCLTAGLLRCARNDGVGDCFTKLALAEPSHPQIPTPNPSLRAAKRRGNPWVWSHGWIASLRSQ